MAKNILLNDVRIVSWRVDVELRRVVATYEILRDDGQVHDRAEAMFWADMPKATMGIDGKTLEQPANWYQLPIGYVQTLTNLTNDLKKILLYLVNA